MENAELDTLEQSVFLYQRCSDYIENDSKGQILQARNNSKNNS